MIHVALAQTPCGRIFQGTTRLKMAARSDSLLIFFIQPAAVMNLVQAAISATRQQASAHVGQMLSAASVVFAP